jgi:hypothetical protein
LRHRFPARAARGGAGELEYFLSSNQWLERAYKQRDGGLNALKVDPMLKNVRQDPRYKALLLKMNLPA